MCWSITDPQTQAWARTFQCLTAVKNRLVELLKQGKRGVQKWSLLYECDGMQVAEHENYKTEKVDVDVSSRIYDVSARKLAWMEKPRLQHVLSSDRSL